MKNNCELFAIKSNHNNIVDAVAGTGKTTTILFPAIENKDLKYILVHKCCHVRRYNNY